MTWYACARSVMPTNMVIESTAIVTMVAAALLASGGLKAGTPFDTASTPVIAVQPFEKAVRSRNRVSGEPAVARGDATCTGITVPASTRHVPTAISERIASTKK